MAVKIPLRSDLPWFSLSVELDGVTYELELQWNHVSEAWYLSLADGTGSAILSGLRVGIGWPMGKRYADPRLPPGALMFVDTTGKDAPPGLNELGSRVELLYFSSAELSG